MKIKEYYLCLLCIIIGLVIVLFFGIASGNPVVPAIVILAGIALVWLCRRKVTDVLSDDLSDMINGRAAMKTIEVAIIIFVIIFVGATTYYWCGGYGSGIRVSEDGSTVILFMQFYPSGNILYKDNYSLIDPPAITIDDLLGIEELIVEGHKIRDYPYIIGAALGFAAVMLALVFSAFSLYYGRKYGCTEDEEQD